MPVTLGISYTVQNSSRDMWRTDCPMRTITVTHRWQDRSINEFACMSLQHPFVLLKDAGILLSATNQNFMQGQQPGQDSRRYCMYLFHRHMSRPEGLHNLSTSRQSQTLSRSRD